MIFKITFTGKTLHAIGAFYQYSEIVEAGTKEAALLRLYDKYEHIHNPIFEDARGQHEYI
jgi:hypothetical protein